MWKKHSPQVHPQQLELTTASFVLLDILPLAISWHILLITKVVKASECPSASIGNL